MFGCLESLTWATGIKAKNHNDHTGKGPTCTHRERREEETRGERRREEKNVFDNCHLNPNPLIRYCTFK